MRRRAGDVTVAYPLFQEESSGANPTSALQLKIVVIGYEKAIELNKYWHSRLPEMGNAAVCRICFGAAYEDIYYAAALWGAPIARMLNDSNMLELRRMAIGPDAPKNTASRMIRIMTKIIKERFPDIETLISYQDTDVHKGTIYKAAGWTFANLSETGYGWESRVTNNSNIPQAPGAKVRWEKKIR